MRNKLVIVWVIIAAAILQYCSSDGQNGHAVLREALVGEWRNVSIKVEINTVNSSDSSTVFKVNEENWVAKLGIKPIQTYFKEDGSYYSEYRTPSDSLVRRPSGTWTVDEDSLIVNQTRPEMVTYKCHTVVRKNLAEFTCLLDWDGDGKEDDLYFGVQRKAVEK